MEDSTVLRAESVYGTNGRFVCEDLVSGGAARGEGKMFVLDKGGAVWYDIAINLGHFAPMNCDAGARRAQTPLK